MAKLFPKIFKVFKLDFIELLFLALAIASVIVANLPSTFLTYFVFAFTIAKYMPSKYALTQFVYALFLPFALIPFYLSLRFYIYSPSIQHFELPFLLLAIFIVLKIVETKFNLSTLTNRGTRNLKHLSSSLSPLVFLLGLSLYLYSKSLGHAIAWFSSGDSRNHLIFARAIFNDGTLNPITMLQQPIGAPAFLGMLLGWRNNSNLQFSSYLANDLVTYGLVWIILITILGVVFSAFLEFYWLQFGIDKKPLKFLIPLVSLVAVTGVVIGPGLIDGFFTAIYGASALGIFILWANELFIEQNLTIKTSIFGILLIFAILMAWSFILLAALPVFLITIFNVSVKKFRISKKNQFLTILFFLLATYAVFNLSIVSNLFTMAKGMLTAGGSIQPPSTRLFFALSLAVLFILVTKRSLGNRLKVAAFMFLFFEFLSIYILKWISGFNTFSWSYYTLKFQWILLITVIGIFASFVLATLYPQISSKVKGLTLPKRIVSISILIMFLFQSSETLYGGQNQWKKAMDGWIQPNAATMNSVLRHSVKEKSPIIFFSYTDPGNQVLGNFWLALYAEPVDPLRGWLYTANTQSDIDFICNLGEYYSKIKIVTTDGWLPTKVNSQCITSNFSYVIERPS